MWPVYLQHDGRGRRIKLRPVAALGRAPVRALRDTEKASSNQPGPKQTPSRSSQTLKSTLSRAHLPPQADVYGELSHLKGTVHLSGQSDQLRLHRLADGAAVTVQGHAVQQEEAGRDGTAPQTLLLVTLLEQPHLFMLGPFEDS